MPNIILANKCNRSCNYCFARNIKNNIRKNELSLKDLRLVLNFLKKNKEREARLMGGEPTLHSKFKKVVEYILKRNFPIHLFTNGLFNEETADFLFKQGRKIKYSFNIDLPNTYSLDRWNILKQNLGKFSVYLHNIGGVVWENNFNINHLIALVKKYKISRAVIIRPANPILGRKNRYIHSNEYKPMVKNLIKEIIKAGRHKIRIGLGCGLSLENFKKKDIETLKKHNVINLNWGCDGNSGKFDIGTDLSVFRCLPLFDWKRKKLSDFNGVKEIEDYFSDAMEKYQSRYSNLDYVHQGPCFVHLLNRLNSKNNGV